MNLRPMFGALGCAALLLAGCGDGSDHATSVASGKRGLGAHVDVEAVAGDRFLAASAVDGSQLPIVFFGMDQAGSHVSVLDTERNELVDLPALPKGVWFAGGSIAGVDSKVVIVGNTCRSRPVEGDAEMQCSKGDPEPTLLAIDAAHDTAWVSRSLKDLGPFTPQIYQVTDDRVTIVAVSADETQTLYSLGWGALGGRLEMGRAVTPDQPVCSIYTQPRVVFDAHEHPKSATVPGPSASVLPPVPLSPEASAALEGSYPPHLRCLSSDEAVLITGPRQAGTGTGTTLPDSGPAEIANDPVPQVTGTMPDLTAKRSLYLLDLRQGAAGPIRLADGLPVGFVANRSAVAIEEQGGFRLVDRGGSLLAQGEMAAASHLALAGSKGVLLAFGPDGGLRAIEVVEGR